MSLKIKDEFFNQIISDVENNTIHFDTDGCACGRLEIKLDENLYLSCYRGCRKSSMTPDNKLWHIEEFEFYPKPYDDYEYPEEPEEVNVKLDVAQSELLTEKLKSVTREIWGYEFRGEY